MSEELVTRALRALRESHDGESDAAALTRARVLLLATTHRKRRRLALAVILPLAAAFALSTAWAAVTGRLPRWLSMSRGQDEESQVDARGGGGGAPPVPAAPLASAQRDTVDAQDAGLQDAAAIAPPASSSPGLVAVVPSARPHAGPTDAPPVRATTDAGGDEELLFAAAQRQHFVAHDPAAALRAWDAYLAAYPRGRLALEARYNRALTLVRLGRTGEARAALAPFAAGREGSYRQREASDLLRALDGGAP